MQVFFCGPSGFLSFRSALGGIDVFSSGFGLAAQAKEMQRFFIRACTAGSFCGCASLELAGARETNSAFGSRGLGELVRAGVVMPVVQVRSAVEAQLVLLVIERRRRSWRRDPNSLVSSSDWLCSALVNSDACCSLARRMGVR
jgi:hypothetical protein